MSSPIDGLRRIVESARLFVSMPYLPGLTPRLLKDPERSAAYPSSEPLERRHGIFRLDEVGLPVLDRGALYGDSVFEGVLVVGGRLFTWKEHLARLYRSAERLQIPIPYDPVELSLRILTTVREVSGAMTERRYLRLVVTRGLGDLGIHPGKVCGGVVYGIAAQIQLYPEELYERGIELSVARQVRRPGPEVLDPSIKSSNYLNNIRALLESLGEGRPETLMLTGEGFVAEATADNLFLVRRLPGWEGDPSRVTVSTPVATYCLDGITRGLILAAAREIGYQVEEVADMVVDDLTGADREVFLTGTQKSLNEVGKKVFVAEKKQ